MQATVRQAWSDANGIIMSAPTGAGKSALASHCHDTFGKTTWLSLSAEGQTHASVTSALVHALQNMDGGWPARTQNETDEALLARWSLDPSRRVHVVLDDYDALLGSNAESELLALLRTWGSALVPVVICRSPLSPALRTLALERAYSLIGDQDFQLNAAEAIAIARGTCAWLDEATLEAIVERAGGWLGGVRLLVHAADSGAPMHDEASSPLPAWTYDAITQNLAPPLRDFLAGLALMPAFDETVSTQLWRRLRVDMPAPALTELSRGDVVVERCAHSALPYRVHPLCADILQQHLQRADAATREHAIERSVSALLDVDQLELSLDLALEHGAWDLAEEAFVGLAPELLPNGREVEVYATLRRFPRERCEGRPRLLICKAWVLANLRRDDEFAAAWERLQRLEAELTPDWQARRQLVASFAVRLGIDAPPATLAAGMAETRPDMPPTPPSPARPGASEDRFLDPMWTMEHTRQLLSRDRPREAIAMVSDPRRWGTGDDPTVEIWRLWWSGVLDAYVGRPAALSLVADHVRAHFSGEATPPDNLGVAFTSFAHAALQRGELARCEGFLETAYETADPLRDPENAVRLVGATMLYEAMTDGQTERETPGDSHAGSGWDRALVAHRGALLARGLEREVFALDALRTSLALDRLAPEVRHRVAARWLDRVGGQALGSVRDVASIVPDVGSRIDDARRVTLRALVYSPSETLDASDWHEDADWLAARARSAGRFQCLVQVALAKAERALWKGDDNAAIEAMERALEIAGDDGMVLPFATLTGKLATLARERAEQFGYSAIVASLPKPNATIVATVLSPAEQRVLSRVAQGETNKEVARSLCVSPATVKKHLENIYAKLGVSGRGKAVKKASEAGLLTL